MIEPCDVYYRLVYNIKIYKLKIKGWKKVYQGNSNKKLMGMVMVISDKIRL